MDAIRDLARQPLTEDEKEAIAQAVLIAQQLRHPFYKHVIRRFDPARAARRLRTLEDGGKRLLTYVKQAQVQLLDFKVLQFTALLRKRRPRVIYEFGAGGSTCLFAELLRENHRLHGIKGELHSFEQSEDYRARITAAFPDELRPYLTLHLCPTEYKWMGPYRALRYRKPSLPHRTVDFAYVDGPDHIYDGVHYRDYPFFNGDLVDLVAAGVDVTYAVNDGRWSNLRFFEHFLPRHRCALQLPYKSFSIRPR